MCSNLTTTIAGVWSDFVRSMTSQEAAANLPAWMLTRHHQLQAFQVQESRGVGRQELETLSKASTITDTEDSVRLEALPRACIRALYLPYYRQDLALTVPMSRLNSSPADFRQLLIALPDVISEREKPASQAYRQHFRAPRYRI